MKNVFIKRLFPVLAVVCFIISILSNPAAITLANTNSDIQHIYDEAALLSSSELNDLENMCTEYSQKDNFDIIILTHDDSSAEYAKKYISDFYDKMLYDNCIILLVDMAHRDVFIEDFGNYARSRISSSKIDTIVSEITPYLSAEDYKTAFVKYIEKSDKYINTAPIYLNPLLHLVLALAIGAIVVGIMAYNAGGKMTANGNNYIDLNNSGLIGRRDDYIRTHVTRVPKPKNNGGGGGISAGGHRFNSGGGKF